MKLSDLKTGMRIVLRNGEEYIVLKNVEMPRNAVGDMFVRSGSIGWMSSDGYDENMNCVVGTGNDRDWDIIEVYAQNEGAYIDGAVLFEPIEKFDLIWKRKDAKKMTVSEICKELGYEVEIIK